MAQNLTFGSLALNDQNYFKNLIHYKNDSPKADGEFFYLTTKKNFNLQNEFAENIKVLSENPQKPWGHFNYPIYCVFPERVKFFKGLGILSNLDLNDCKELNVWKNGIGLTDLSVVFSSSYPNNPSSMFGHTLLRLKGNSNSELLDYSVTFSAWQDVQESGFFMAVKGLLGGYRGLVEMGKYYQKVNEYNFYESRDLYEYPIIMTNVQRERFLDHLWEIYQTAYFDYYFADENCSSILFDILKVAFKEKSIGVDKRIFYLPQELVESLTEAEVLDLANIKVRESLKKQFENKWFNLNNEEQKNFKQFIQLKEIPSKSSEDSKFNLNAKTLSALIDFFNYTRAREKGHLKELEKKKYNAILIARSKISEKNDESPKKIDHHYSYPHLAHPPIEMGFYSSYQEKLGFGLEFRPLFHHFLEIPKRHEEFQNFEILKSNLEYSDKKLRLKKFSLIDLKSLHNYTFYDPQFSWMVEITHRDHIDYKFQEINFGMGQGVRLKHTYLGYFIDPSLVRLNEKLKMGARLIALLNQNISNQYVIHFENSFRIYKDLDFFESDLGVSKEIDHNNSLELNFFYSSKSIFRSELKWKKFF